jgi:hypothetical protein
MYKRDSRLITTDLADSLRWEEDGGFPMDLGEFLIAAPSEGRKL